MKSTLTFLLLCLPLVLTAQNDSPFYKITYSSFSNGEKSNNKSSIYFTDQFVFLTDADDKIQQYIDLNKEQNLSTIEYQNQIFGLVTPFEELPKPIIKDDYETILGYKCRLATYSYFSNQIDVWYTEEAVVKGSPGSTYLPNKNALVLKIVRNNNYEIRATEIVTVESPNLLKNFTDKTIRVSDAEFEELKIESRYKKLQVFDKEIINFEPDLITVKEENLKTDQVYRFSKGSVIMKKIKLTPELKKSGNIFAKLHAKSNGDAYDRTGTVFILPTRKTNKKTILSALQHGLKELPVYSDNKENVYQGIVQKEDYVPPVEIMRFFTSFGASHFNDKRKINNYDWAENVTYKQDVSALIPLEEDEIWVGVFIGNYDSGGHIVSLELDFYPAYGSELNSKEKRYINPLFSTLNIMEMEGQNYGRLFDNDTLKLDFRIEEDVKDLQLLFTSTGHGGWGGGDEFNPKMNRILIDGQEVFKIVPWRTDCASYRLSNPASGNFGNGLSSSDLSRSNWCPATLTPAYIVPLDSLSKGQHTLEVIIDQGPPEGSSFSHWNVSGILVGQTAAD